MSVAMNTFTPGAYSLVTSIGKAYCFCSLLQNNFIMAALSRRVWQLNVSDVVFFADDLLDKNKFLRSNPDLIPKVEKMVEGGVFFCVDQMFSPNILRRLFNLFDTLLYTSIFLSSFLCGVVSKHSACLFRGQKKNSVEGDGTGYLAHFWSCFRFIQFLKVAPQFC